MHAMQQRTTQTKQPWFQRRWVRMLLGVHLALALILAYPGYAYYRAWIRPDRPQPVWAGPLTLEQRQAAFDALGREVERLYPYFAEKGVDWQATLAEFRPRVEAAQSDREFYGLLGEMLARLNDGHTRLTSYPGAAAAGRPGLRLLYTESQYVVAAVQAGTEPQVRPGDVLLSVDGRSPEEVAAAIRGRVSASTPAQAAAIQAAALLNGALDAPAILRLRRPEGEEYAVALPRSAQRWSEPFEARLVEGFGYVRIPGWGGDVDQRFDQALETFRDAPGLIIDVRGNGGGSDPPAERVMGRLLAERVLVSRVRLRFDPFWSPWQRRVVKPRGPWTYTGPVVLLINGEVFSSNDFFVGGLVRAGRATAIGSPTGGGSGFPAQITLPGGAKVRISRWQEAFGDGTLVEGNGTAPQIAVAPTIADLAAGRDPVLERAVRFLRESR